MNKIILTAILLAVTVGGHAQYVFKHVEPKDVYTDIPQGPTPKYAPNGRSFALITNTKRKSKIVIITGDSTEIINGAQNDFKWSHDGESIIFTAKDEQNRLKVFKYILKTKEQIKISHNSGFSDFYPSIAYGDSIITYYNYRMEDKDQRSEIYFADTKSGTWDRLVADSMSDYFHPSWSPLGSLFLYWRSGNDGDFIEIIEIKTGRIVLQMSANGFLFKDWSNDEREILCESKGKLFKIRLADGAKTEISSTFEKILRAKWSPKGDIITFNADEAIYTVDSNGQNQRKILGKGLDPSWHPSGQKIIFVKDAKGYPIYEVDVHGENLKLLFDGKRKGG